MKEAIDYCRKPLFEGVGAQCEREDEWSFPKGFSFGGMFDLVDDNFIHYASQYFNAAEAILDLVQKNSVADYTVSNPVFFLYRHSTELYLKAIIQNQGDSVSGKEHSLHRLANRTKGLEPWVLKRIQEINCIDPQSTILRYGGERPLTDEIWSEITFLRKAMRILRKNLEQLAGC